MERCHGKTKAGNRCKRSASAGSLYCSTHADQAGKSAPDAEVPEGVEGDFGERDAVEILVFAAVLGVAVIVVMKIGRLFRL